MLLLGYDRINPKVLIKSMFFILIIGSFWSPNIIYQQLVVGYMTDELKRIEVQPDNQHKKMKSKVSY